MLTNSKELNLHILTFTNQRVLGKACAVLTMMYSLVKVPGVYLMNATGLFVDYQRVIAVVYSFSGMISLHIERNSYFLMSKRRTAWLLKSCTRGAQSAIHVCTIGEAVIFHQCRKWISMKAERRGQTARCWEAEWFMACARRTRSTDKQKRSESVIGLQRTSHVLWIYLTTGMCLQSRSFRVSGCYTR